MSLYVLFKKLSDSDGKSLILRLDELSELLECYGPQHSFDGWNRNMELVQAEQVDSLKRLVEDMLSEFQLYEVLSNFHCLILKYA